MRITMIDGKRMSELLTDDEKDFARYLEKEMGTKIVQIDKNNEVWKRERLPTKQKQG